MTEAASYGRTNQNNRSCITSVRALSYAFAEKPIPQRYSRCTTTQERRTELDQRKLRRRCFIEGYNSKLQNNWTLPRVFLYLKRTRSRAKKTLHAECKTNHQPSRRKGAVKVVLRPKKNRSIRHAERTGNRLQISNAVRQLIYGSTVGSKQTTVNQCVPQMVSTLLFNESEVHTLPVSVLPDSGA